MELKNKLQDYTRSEFIDLVKALGTVGGQEQLDLINHFNAILELPTASDLVFNPPQTLSLETLPSPEYVTAYIQLQYNQKGIPAFKDDTLPVPKDKKRLSKEESAIKLSTLKQASAQLLLARIALAGRAIGESLNRFGSLLDNSAGQPSPETTLADHVERIVALEAAQDQVDRTSAGFEHQQLGLDMSLDGARRDSSSPFYDASMQTALLGQLIQERDAYLARLSTTRQQRQALHERAMAFFAEASRQLSQLRAAVDNPPPQVFQASLSSARQYPVLMLPEASPSGVTQPFDDLLKALRSAVAEYRSQPPASEAAHPGTYAGFLTFYFNNLSDEQHFGLCLPLAELARVENIDLQSLAAGNGEIDLPLRLCTGTTGVQGGTLHKGLREIKRLEQVRLTPTHGGQLPSAVRVRMAAWDEPSRTFGFSEEGARLAWQADNLAPVPNLSGKPPRIGSFQATLLPVAETFEALGDVHFNDYVVVFPSGSGVAAMYVMLAQASAFGS